MYTFLTIAFIINIAICALYFFMVYKERKTRARILKAIDKQNFTNRETERITSNEGEKP